MGEELTRAKEIDDAVKAADAKRRADAEAEVYNGEKLDKVLACLDSLGKRMDAFEKRPVEEAGEFEKLPREDGEGDGEIEEKGKPRELGADSRKDSRMDSAVDAEEIEHFKAETGATHAI